MEKGSYTSDYILIVCEEIVRILIQVITRGITTWKKQSKQESCNLTDVDLKKDGHKCECKSA